MHVHQALLIARRASNLFYDADDPYHLSRLARHFIAGQLEHARGMCAVLAPLVNSYKRLVPGFEAPAVRQLGAHQPLGADPHAARPAGSMPTRHGSSCAARTRAATRTWRLRRCCGPALMASSANCRLPRRLRRTCRLSNRRAGRLQRPHAAGSLEEALNELRRDDVICEALGPHVLERFLEAKEIEWEEYRKQVTPWELERYLSVY